MGLLNNFMDKFKNAEFTVAPQKKLKTISADFKKAFNLSLVFYKGVQIADGELTLAALNKKTTKDVKANADGLKIKGSTKVGDAEKLSAWFASNLELDILGSVSSCSKVQATQIMKDFFVNYTPKTFTVIHKSGKAPLTYAIGSLSAGGEKFRITLFVMTQEKGNQIQQLRIERE